MIYGRAQKLRSIKGTFLNILQITTVADSVNEYFYPPVLKHWSWINSNLLNL